MTQASKIHLSASRDIPFNKLVLSQSNVRRVKAGLSIEDLAADIAQRTLLQSLCVRPMRDADGNETGLFEVPAGGRRFRALELLVKQKRMARTEPVPCIVRDEGLMEEDSLAENVHRMALHPRDQFRAFQALHEKGLGDEEIAARFFVTPTVVKQRLKLANVSPKLLDLYVEDVMSLEQLMAFTVTSDHARQEQVWDSLARSYNREPYYIRRQLTEGAVRASDKRALFVGLADYEAAGGVILRDLFQQDDGGWLQDVGLLDRLVAEKLAIEAEAIRAEGWKWIEVATDLPYGHTHGLRKLVGITGELSAEEQAAKDALVAEYAKLSEDYAGAEDLPEDVDQRLGEIEAALEVFDRRPMQFDPQDVARAGAFVSLGFEGTLTVDRGYVRKEDEPAVADTADGQDVAAEDNAASDHGNADTSDRAESDDDEDGLKPLPDRLLSELSAHRTLALRDALANNPDVALTALLHKLCLDTFRHVPNTGCLEAYVRPVQFPVQGSDLKDSASAKSIAERHQAWMRDLPADSSALWDRLATFDDATRLSLLAHCVSFGVNAVHEKVDRYSTGAMRRRMEEADRLSRAVKLDMVEAGWRPTVENYLARVPKARILQAVREAKGAEAATRIEAMKKPDMAKAAEEILDGSGWLPEPLRTAGQDTPSASPDEESAPVDDLDGSFAHAAE